MRCAGKVTRIGNRRDAYRDLVGRSDRRSLARPRGRREGNIKIIFKTWDGEA
jgi:hypothetical protein